MPDGLTTWDTTHFLVSLMIETAKQGNGGRPGIGEDELDVLVRDIDRLRDYLDDVRQNQDRLQTENHRLWAALTQAALVSPISFVFSGTPVEGSMINVPIVGREYGVFEIRALNQFNTRYYNATNPLTPSVFTLTRITAGGATNPVGVINKPAGTGLATYSGAGLPNVTHGDTLRMTATTVGGNLANVGISIAAIKLYSLD